jgi:hypothetical protein
MSSSSETPQTDLEYPQLWENYGHIIMSRQRMLQSAMAYYISADESVKALYDCEIGLGLPKINYAPQTQQGKNSLSRFTSICSSYCKVLARFKETYEF